MAHKLLPMLDERLSAALSLVPNGCVAADIGCDHGKLSVMLSTKCKRVIAVDVGEKPLEVARAQMQKSGVTNVECRLGNGLLALSENEADTIIIAGLSAKTICDILAAAPWVCKNGGRLILVPATKPHELRAWLYKNGFYLVSDMAVKAAGRCYAVMAAEYCAKQQTLTLLQSVLGNISGDAAYDYLKKEAAKFLKAAQSDELSHYKDIAGQIEQEAEKCRR